MNDVLEIEKAITGSVLLFPGECTKVFEIIKPEHFNEVKCRKIYEAVTELYKRNREIDILTVTQQLKSVNELDTAGGAYFVSSVGQRVASTANIEAYCYVLIEDFLRRKMGIIAQLINAKATDPSVDVFDLIGNTEKQLGELLNGIIQKGPERIDAVKNRVLIECESVLTTGKPSGVLSSIKALNNQTNGWQKGDLIIVAGRPGMGKTSVSLDFSLTPALNGIPTAFFSLEMSAEQLASRVLSIVSTLNVQEIVNKTLDADKLFHVTKYGKSLDGIPMFIDETAALSLFDLRNKARRLKREQNIELIVIDYLQLMRGSDKKNGNREQEISEISRGLKALAKELQIPVIALSQLSRECEKRADKKPMLSDLRESGAIEQDADMIIFPFRPSYYGQEKYYIGNQEIDTYQLLIFIIAKFRNGSTGEVRARFIDEYTMITNYQYDQF